MRRRLAQLLTILLLVVTSGCALQNAIDRGHDSVQRGQYRTALAQYQRAARLDPSSQEARGLVAQITPFAIREAEGDMRSELAAGSYERAMQHVHYVRRLDVERGAELAAEVEQLMHAALEGLMREKKMAVAYPLALRANQLFPRMEGLRSAFTRLRAHYVADSEQLTAAGQYQEALAALDVITHHEPAMRDHLAPRRKRIRGLWADRVAERAAAAEADERIGAATALYGFAFEIAGRARDGDAMRKLARILRREGRFSLSMQFDGDRARKQRVAELVTQRALGVEGVAIPDDDDESVSMAGSIHAAATVCSQSFRRTTDEQDYVAGTREVSNPAYEDIERALGETRSDISTLSSQATSTASEVRRYDDAARRCRQNDSSSAETKLREAQRQLGVAQGRVDAQRARVEELERRLSKAKDAKQRERIKQRLAKARRRLAELKRELNAAERDVSRAEAAFDSAETKCERQRQRANEARAQLAEIEGLLSASESQRQRLDNERATTPQTVTEEIIETFEFEVRVHSRRCKGSVTAELQPAWAGEERHHFASKSATQDESHPAHPRYGVPNDPLSFPLTDTELIDDVDNKGARRLAKVIGKHVRDYYRSMVARAGEMADSDADGATDMMVAIVLAAHSHLDKGQRGRILDHLRSHYGLSKLETLRK